MKQAPTQHEGDALIVAGPTCSGKSALALALAGRLGGVVINADSMQVYRELRVLTARPTPQEEACCPHALYGVRAAAQAGSVAWWRGEALAAMRAAWAAGHLPILCGGTGLYFAALTEGLTDIPETPAAARLAARDLLAEIGSEALHARLTLADPQTAASLRASDGQRLARAWEVLVGTSRGLADWRAAAPPQPAPARFTALLIAPAREALRAAIAARFARMLEQGALEEVAALLALELPPSLPAMRAHGVPELAAYLRGEIALDEATRWAILSQGRYCKRQATWFAHHRLAPPERTDIITTRIAGMTQEMQSLTDKIMLFIEKRVDALSGGRP